ncbi:hypothetical protein [Vreelandella andesensis]|nr:hypothetical protein [Halomonas andesensis]
MKQLTSFALLIILAALLLSAVALAWWGWHSLDGSLLLVGSRLC